MFHATAPPPTNPEVDLHLPDIDFEPAPTHTDLSDAPAPDTPDAVMAEPEMPEPEMPEPVLPDLDLPGSGPVDSDPASAPVSNGSFGRESLDAGEEQPATG